MCWGTQFHDSFMLPHFLWADLRGVIDHLVAKGVALDLRRQGLAGYRVSQSDREGSGRGPACEVERECDRGAKAREGWIEQRRRRYGCGAAGTSAKELGGALQIIATLVNDQHVVVAVAVHVTGRCHTRCEDAHTTHRE